VYKKHITDLNELKQRLRREWAKLGYVVIAASDKRWTSVLLYVLFAKCMSSDNSVVRTVLQSFSTCCYRRLL